jgi:hypothetical protein
VHVPFKHSAALLGASAVIALAGCGSSATQSSTGSASTGSTGAAAQTQAGPGTPPATQLKSLADALGVSVAKLRSAMESTRPAAGRPATRPRRSRRPSASPGPRSSRRCSRRCRRPGRQRGAARRPRARRRPVRRPHPDRRELSQGDQPGIGRIARRSIESFGTLRWLPTRSGAGHISPPRFRRDVTAAPASALTLLRAGADAPPSPPRRARE